MIEKKFNFINYIIGFGIVVCAFLFSHLDSYADVNYSIDFLRPDYEYNATFSFDGENERCCIYFEEGNINFYLGSCYFVTTNTVRNNIQVLWNYPGNIFNQTIYSSDFYEFKSYYLGSNGWPQSILPVFYDLNDCLTYLRTGVNINNKFLSDLQLDDFKVNSFQWNNFVESKFAVYWSDARIYNVKVNIMGTRQSSSYVGSSSPYSQNFDARDYANTNGDIITLIATPYDSYGRYGPSLMYSFEYKLNSPLGNVLRKIFKTPYSDNTIEIPYNAPSSNEPYKLPVNEIGENKCYKIYYNPETNNYEFIEIYNIYNYPVIIYPNDTPEEEVQETQNTIINDFNTTNYYTIINNIYNYDISYNDISYGDVSSGDVETSYKDITGFFKGFSSFFAKLLSFFAKLFPFFPAYVTVFILAALGIIISLFLIKLFITIVKGFFLR